MKVVFVLEHYYPYLGGAEKLFKQLAEALAKHGNEVTVVTTKFKPNLPKAEILNGVKIKRVNCYNRFLFTVFSLPPLLRWCRQADIIHTTTYNAALPAWMIGKLYRIKIILTFHEVWGKLWFKLPFLSRIERWVFYAFEALITRLPFHCYIAVSMATAQSLQESGVPKKKIKHIYNGIDYDRFKIFRHQPPKVFNLLYFGRSGVSKGLDLLLPAWGIFTQKHPEVVLQLILPRYPNSLYHNIEQLIAKHCSTEKVLRFHDLSEEELFTKISEVSAVVIPSYSEGFCFAAAEATAIGTPIISSGKKALAEVVSGKYLEMKSQTTDALVDAIEEAYHGRWLYRPLQFFSLQRTLASYLTIYEEQ
jgi:glycosyltransferase involved in cell wall biosynthesis